MLASTTRTATGRGVVAVVAGGTVVWRRCGTGLVLLLLLATRVGSGLAAWLLSVDEDVGHATTLCVGARDALIVVIVGEFGDNVPSVEEAGNLEFRSLLVGVCYGGGEVGGRLRSRARRGGC